MIKIYIACELRMGSVVRKRVPTFAVEASKAHAKFETIGNNSKADPELRESCLPTARALSMCLQFDLVIK